MMVSEQVDRLMQFPFHCIVIKIWVHMEAIHSTYLLTIGNDMLNH